MRQVQASKFFDPSKCIFEALGFYEELLEPETGKVIGYRSVPEPDRPLGSDGRKEFDITENLILRKGTKTVELKASKQKPKRVVGMIQVVCGHLKSNIAAEKAGTFWPQNPHKTNQ